MLNRAIQAKSTNVINTSKAIIVHHSLNNWAGFKNWWQRKSKQIWLLQKKKNERLWITAFLFIMASKGTAAWKTPKPLYKHIHTLKFSHSNSTTRKKDDKSPCLGAFYIPFHFGPQIHPYVITCIEEWSWAASVVFCNRSFRPATVLPRAAMSQHEQPAWLASWDGRAQKNKLIVELSEHMACPPTASWGETEARIQSDF